MYFNTHKSCIKPIKLISLVDITNGFTGGKKTPKNFSLAENPLGIPRFETRQLFELIMGSSLIEKVTGGLNCVLLCGLAGTISWPSILVVFANVISCISRERYVAVRLSFWSLRMYSP